MSTTRGLAIIIATLPLLGCPPSFGEVADRYAARMNARNAELKQVVAALPAPGSLSAPTAAAGLTPAPVYDEATSTYTMDLLQVEQVDDPAVDLRLQKKLDLILSNVYIQPMRDVAPSTEEARSRSSNDYYPTTFEKALALRYIALVRTVEFTPPEAVSDTEYTGGTARLEVFLIDLQDRSVKASFPVTARPAEKVEYEYKEGDDRKERLKAFAYSTMWESARLQIAEGLKQHAGATVVFD
jgi:hypothetical protein